MEVRTKVLALLALSLSALLVGCSVGEYGAPGSGTTGKGDGTGPDAAPGSTGSTDEANFMVQMKPIVTAAGCLGCHGPQAPTLESWTKLQPKYQTKAGAMIIITKGPHQGSPYFDATQKAAVEQWVNGISQ